MAACQSEKQKRQSALGKIQSRNPLAVISEQLGLFCVIKMFLHSYADVCLLKIAVSQDQLHFRVLCYQSECKHTYISAGYPRIPETLAAACRDHTVSYKIQWILRLGTLQLHGQWTLHLLTDKIHVRSASPMQSAVHFLTAAE